MHGEEAKPPVVSLSEGGTQEGEAGQGVEEPGAELRGGVGLVQQLLEEAGDQTQQRGQQGHSRNLEPCCIMGNGNGKDTHGPTACSPLSGSPLDFFHTPPTTPSEAELSAMALSSSSGKAQTPPPPLPAPTNAPPTSGAAPSSSSSSATANTNAATPLTEWAQKISSSIDWAVISVESDAPLRAGDPAAAGKVTPATPPPAERSWQERDSGVEPQGAAEEEMTQVLLSLMEHQRASLGLSPQSDVTSGAVELLRRLISERDELLEEVDTLKETLRRERLEWRQFQCDLQVAVSVADRLRSEAEQALGSLRQSHRAAEQQLALALGRQRDKDHELEGLRAEHGHVLRELDGLALKWEGLRERGGAQAGGQGGEGPQAERRDSGEKRGEGTRETEEQEERNEEEEENGDEKESDPQEGNGSGGEQLTGRGVAEGYLRNLAALEKKKEEGRGPKEPRRIVMLSERSWSLSRLPLPVGSPSQNGAMNTSTTLPLCKKEQPAKGRRLDRILQRQESWSNFNLGKQEEEQSSDYVKPQDGFSALLRRHGGSRRNSLLRWCQGRTQGYKNIEITNFSSSWEDGLAFCAVYHTYLPTHIPFDSLSPEDKRGNLDLAFKTGAGVGITAALTVEEMLKASGPDWQKVLGYVESIFRHFEM